MTDLIVVEDQKKFRVETDYKTVWEWYILKNVLRLIQVEDIVEGLDIFRDLVILLEADSGRFNTFYDNFYIEKVKGKIALNVDIGALKSEISSEIEARRIDGEKKISLLDAVRLVQAALPRVRLASGTAIRLYFDELEFFMSEDGDGERDRRMVRDLMFACNNVNTLLTACNMDAVVYASIRSEILRSIGSTNQEVGKLVTAFSVVLDWYSEGVEDHPVLSIFENKIQYSEVNSVGAYTEDVWRQYFPLFVLGKDIRRYLLDSGLHRPRGVLLRLVAALEKSHSKVRFDEESFLESEELFGDLMLEEYLDEIAATLDEDARVSVISILRGNHYAFDRVAFAERIKKLSATSKPAKVLLEHVGVDNMLKLLFRVGIIGNHFEIKENGHTKNRQIWAFRGVSEPLLDKRFVVHQSVRKTLATI
jgi:hypothetical protein